MYRLTMVSRVFDQHKIDKSGIFEVRTTLVDKSFKSISHLVTVAVQLVRKFKLNTSMVSDLSGYLFNLDAAFSNNFHKEIYYVLMVNENNKALPNGKEARINSEILLQSGVEVRPSVRNALKARQKAGLREMS